MRRRSGPESFGVVLLGAGAAVGCTLYARRCLLRWGATVSESRAFLAGDDLIPTVDLSATRAITLRVPADEVWPWVAQLGQGRGGFYSYDFLENLVGCDIHSAERVVPEWQNIAIGDTVNLYPEGPLVVAALEMGRSLVIRGGVPMGAIPRRPTTSHGRSCWMTSRGERRGCSCASGTPTRGGGHHLSSSLRPRSVAS